MRDEVSVGTKMNARGIVRVSAGAGRKVIEVTERTSECEDEVRWWLRRN